MVDRCPLCFTEGSLRIRTTTRVGYAARCLICNTDVPLDDTLEYVRDYDYPEWVAWLGVLIVVVCILVAAAVDVV